LIGILLRRNWKIKERERAGGNIRTWGWKKFKN